MDGFKQKLNNSIKAHTLRYNAFAYLSYKFGYGNSHWANELVKYKIYNVLKKKFAPQIGKTEFEKHDENMKNTVWVCWLQGFENAPELVKQCVESMRHYIKDREIVLIDENNYSDYITLPDYIIEKRKKGVIPHAHFSDIIRAQLLIEHGGLWLDSTVYLSGDIPRYITDNDFFVYHEGFFEHDLINMASWIIYADAPDSPLLCQTQALVFEYWRKYNVLKQYFLFHILFRIVTEKLCDEWEKVPYFSHMDQHLLSNDLEKPYSEQRWKDIKALSTVHKLTNKLDIAEFGGDSFYAKLNSLYEEQ